MKEDYVSFETAKLLKEKGFNEICAGYYDRKGRFDMTLSKVNNIRWEGHYIAGNISAPTQQMTLAWLREVHNKHIQVGYDIQLSWYYDIIDLKETVSYDYEEMKCWYNEHNLNNYEEACELAIKYCLEHLI